MNADCLGIALGVLELNLPANRQREIVLRNLIGLGKIGIEILLTGEYRVRRDLAAYAHRRADQKLDGFLVHVGKHAGMPAANGTNLTVGLSAPLGRAATE